MSERITIQTIVDKEFDVKPRGYDREAVDAFLDEICDEFERMNNEQAALKQQLLEAQAAASRAAAQPAPEAVPQVTKVVPVAKPAEEKKPEPELKMAAADDSNTRILAMLEMAAKVKEETIAEAKQQAEKLIEQANEEARARIGDLAAERDSLTNQVAALKKTVADYRTRFEALLQAQQEAMDKINDL